MGSLDVEVFGVSDDRPVDRCFFAHDAELNECPELSDHLQALFDSRRFSASLDVNIAAVTLCQLKDPTNGALFFNINSDVGAAKFGQFKPLIVRVDSDQQCRPFQLGGGDHSEVKRSAARDHNHALIPNAPASPGV